MAKTAAERNRDKEARKRDSGLREIRVWVPDREWCGPEAETKVRALAAELCAEAKRQKEQR